MSETPGGPAAPCCQQRRGFLEKAAAIGAGALALVAPLGVGVNAFLHPLRKAGGGDGDLLKITSLESLPEDGTPRKFNVTADRVDAWNRFTNEPVGAVFLRRIPGQPGKVAAFQVTCPHAGCAINFEPTDQGGRFFCPCHTAAFDLEGRRTDAVSPSPRDMDDLEVEIRNEHEIWVRFRHFVLNKSEKIAKA